MSNIFKISKRTAIVFYIILDTLFVGIGMGIPFLCILLGFPAGWYLAKRLTIPKRDINDNLSIVLKYSFFKSLFTFILMLLIWGPISTMLWDPNANIANFGIPMILYDPKVSFIGWIVLMVFISPFLQMLTTIFASHVTLWRLSKNKQELNKNSKEPITI